MQILKYRIFTARLMLGICGLQWLAAPVARAEISGAYYSDSDYTKLESQYIDAVNLGEDAKMANMIATGVWGVAAAVCGMNCFDYLGKFRGQKNEIVTQSKALVPLVQAVATACAAGDPSLTKYPGVVGQYQLQIEKNLAGSEGASAKSAGEAGKGVQDLEKTVTKPQAQVPLKMKSNLSSAPGRFRNSLRWVLTVPFQIGLPTLLENRAQAATWTRQGNFMVQTSDTGQELQRQSLDVYQANTHIPGDTYVPGNLPETPPKVLTKTPADADPLPLGEPDPGPIAPKAAEPAASVIDPGLADGSGIHTYEQELSLTPQAPPKVETPLSPAPGGPAPSGPKPDTPKPAGNTSKGSDKDSGSKDGDNGPQFTPEEGIAKNVNKMVAVALEAGTKGAAAAAKLNTKAPGTGAACQTAAAKIQAPAGKLQAAAKGFEAEITNLVATAKWCNGMTVVAGVTDAGLSMGLAKDTTAGMIGLAGAAPGVVGLATQIMDKGPTTANSASTAGLLSCIATATSLAEVAVKVVGINSSQKSVDENQKSLDELHSGAWLEKIFQGGIFGIESAHAAVELSLKDSCNKSVTAPMPLYSCALAGDNRLKQYMSQIPGGGNGLFMVAERIFGVNRTQFLNPNKPVSMPLVIGLMTKNNPSLAPGMAALYGNLEKKASQYLKMSPNVRAQMLAAADRAGNYEHSAAPSLLGDQAAADHQAVVGPSGVQLDAFALPQAPEADEPGLDARAPATVGPLSAPRPLGSAPGLGAEEISPANGKSLFELVSRTIRDHRELVGSP